MGESQIYFQTSTSLKRLCDITSFATALRMQKPFLESAEEMIVKTNVIPLIFSAFRRIGQSPENCTGLAIPGVMLLSSEQDAAAG
jgi:hypothetical protein